MLLNLGKKSGLYFLFYFVFTTLSQCALVTKPWTTSIEHVKKLWSTTNIGIQSFVLKFSRDRFFIVSFHFMMLCTGHSTKKVHNCFRYRARLRFSLYLSKVTSFIPKFSQKKCCIIPLFFILPCRRNSAKEADALKLISFRVRKTKYCLLLLLVFITV